MFKYLNYKEQLKLEQQKNAQLNAQVQELENAILELAELTAEVEEAQEEVQDNGEDLLS